LPGGCRFAADTGTTRPPRKDVAAETTADVVAQAALSPLPIRVLFGVAAKPVGRIKGYHVFDAKEVLALGAAAKLARLLQIDINCRG
jgi:hypothetical protein